MILRDGGTLRLRAPLALDVEALVEFFGRLSEQSVYRRFHGFPSLGASQLEPFVDPDWRDRGSLIGTVSSDGESERIVALANYVRLRDPSCAEVAFAVADELQGYGVGTRLLEQLAESAAEAGISTFVAEVMPDNSPMLRVFEDAGFEASRRLEGGTVEVRLAIAPTETYRAAVDERDHVAVAASLAPFFAPRTVAVVGAFARRGSIGGELFRNILLELLGHRVPDQPEGALGRRRQGVPVDRGRSRRHRPGHLLRPGQGRARRGRGGAAQGHPRAVRDLRRLRRDGRRRDPAPGAAARARAGARGAADRPELPRHLRRQAGPERDLRASQLSAGNIGFSSQSGALGLAVLEQGASRGLGLSAFVSVGNKADVSSNDLLEYWEDDPETDLILLYLESFGNPRKFARVARRVARKKPILAMKGGRTSAGQRAAGSHTAALAGSTTAVEALFRQAGVIQADSLEELADVAVLLSRQPLPRGRRVAVLTNAGGLGILCADACSTCRPRVAAALRGTRAQPGRAAPRRGERREPG